MTTRSINGTAGLQELIGQHLGYSDYMTVSQEQVNTFADATGDHQWIHIDVARATAGPSDVVTGTCVLATDLYGLWILDGC